MQKNSFDRMSKIFRNYSNQKSKEKELSESKLRRV
jgi:hypothetical protein